MNFFGAKRNRVKIKVIKSPAGEPVNTPEPAPVWTVDDVLNLNKFFQTGTGVKLLKRARAMEYSIGITSCRDVFHTQHSAGVATGVSDTIQWLESLASEEMRQKLSEPTPAEVGNPHKTTDREHDDAGLVEKYSP